MTRWARSKSTHKHERQPQEATAWKDFVAQRQAQHRKNAAEDVSGHAGLAGAGNQEQQARETGIHRPISREKLAGAEMAAKGVVASAKTPSSRLESSKKKIKPNKLPKENLSSQTDTVGSEVPPVPKGSDGKPSKKRKALHQKEGASPATANNSRHVAAGTEVPSLDQEATSSAAKKRKKAPGGKRQKGPPAGARQSDPNPRGSKTLRVRHRSEATTVASGSYQEPPEDLATIAAPSQSQSKKGGGTTVEQRDPSSVRQGHAASADGMPRGAKAERLQRLRKEREAKGLLLLPEKVERKIYMLKKAMRKKGLPGDEIKEAVRKMRRKEELLFRRQLAKLCFKCRQPGHRVQDCPIILRDSDQAVGICFKCGSTEHFSSACAVRTSASNEFPFANCFICQQQGHLSRKCPQNDRGAYPRGGHCNFCGAVDHFKRECPEMERNKKKAEEGDEVPASVADLAQSADAEDLQPLPAPPKAEKSRVVTF